MSGAGASGGVLEWREVLARHRTLRGIGAHSLLADRGESGYRNRFLPDRRIAYVGEGLEGHQQPAGGNLRLLEAHADQTSLRVYLRERPNRWRDLGEYLVEHAEYRLEPAEGRRVYWFTLAPLSTAYPQPDKADLG